MNFYRQSIVLFGMILPAIFALAVVGVGYFMKNKMAESYEVKKKNYRTHHQARAESAEVEKKVLVQRPHLERWQEQLAKETASEIGINLREITAALPNKEIQQTSFDPSSSSGGFGSSSAQNASQVRIGFRGTYRTLQKAFVELETRMPQLQLESLSLQPVATSGFLLTLQVTYTAWQN